MRVLIISSSDRQESEYSRELPPRQQALHHVGAVEAVHAVGAEHAALAQQHGAAAGQEVPEFRLEFVPFILNKTIFSNISRIYLYKKK